MMSKGFITGGTWFESGGDFAQTDILIFDLGTQEDSNDDDVFVIDIQIAAHGGSLSLSLSDLRAMHEIFGEIVSRYE
jgi:hypothetical protein